jgi:mono/diheme cytochrome c family protein
MPFRDRGAIAMAAVYLGIVATGLTFSPATRAQTGTDEKPYTVKDGKVDKATYNGWRRYTESCLRCHGPDGAGSSYAPALTDSLKQMTEDQFKELVVNGRQNVTTSAENVIYGYLKARSDGVLDRGRPEKIEE